MLPMIFELKSPEYAIRQWSMHCSLLGFIDDVIDRQRAADLAGRTSDRPYQQSQLPSDNRLLDSRMHLLIFRFPVLKFIPFICAIVYRLFAFFTAKRLNENFLLF